MPTHSARDGTTRREVTREVKQYPAMPIGLLTLEINLPEAHSLKDKRQVLRSLKDRLRKKFNVAVAEMEHQDLWQRFTVGVVTLADQAGFVEHALQGVLEDSETLLGRRLVDHQIELL